MNNSNKNSILENRFENDANQGYEIVHGADAYFKNIKSPFNSIPKQGFLSEWGIISLEIFIAITLIVTAKLIDLNTDSSEFSFSGLKKESSHVATANLVEENSFKMDEQTKPTNNEAFTHSTTEIEPSSFSSAFVTDTCTTLFVIEENGEIKKIDSIVPSQPLQTFIYADYKSMYELRYIENLLVIDYSDTLFIGKKLNPILSGVPAPFENKDRIEDSNSFLEAKDLLVKRDNYLINLSKPIKLLTNKKYTKALKEFGELLKENPEDQNALFYSGLVYFNLGEYRRALANFDLIKSLKNPLFEEDVDWLLVKIYEELGLKENSVKLMKNIARSNSFYRSQAIADLKK